MEAEIWKTATTGAIRFPLGSNKPGTADTTFLIGHRDGVLYLLLQYDWPETAEPVAKATARDGSVWSDDGGEIFFTRVNDVSQARQLLFNLKDVQTDYQIKTVSGLSPDLAWDADWKLACRKGDQKYNAEFAIPLSGILGLRGRRGEVFRLGLVRNRVGRSRPIMHWSPMKGAVNCNPDHFGFAVLTGPNPSRMNWKDWSLRDRAGLIFMDHRGEPSGLSGEPVSLTLLHPVAREFGSKASSRWRADLRDSKSRIVASRFVTVSTWPQTFTVEPGSLPEGDYHFELRTEGSRRAEFATVVHWRPTIRIEAENSESCRVFGTQYVYEHPRSTGVTVVSLNKGSRVTVAQYGRAVYLILPPTFPTPGPWYASQSGVRLRCRVDARPVRDVWCVTARRNVPLAENLPPGRHKVEVAVAEGGYAVIDAFVFSSRPLSMVQGVITSDEYSELLTDVRADLIAGGKVLRSEYVRNPVNSTFELLDVAPGRYQLRFTANGWATRATAPFTVSRPGQKVDVGVICLSFDQELVQYWSDFSISARFRRTFNVTPGSAFQMQMEISGKLKSARLVSRLKTIVLPFEDSRQVPMGASHSPIHFFTFYVPSDTPHDMYSLETTIENSWGTNTTRRPQTVCVREALPPLFAVAGVGHMHTWGQQTSEYLARVAETAQLAGARALLISNEVNAAYIAGALKDLRIPYSITSGNHTMSRWDNFYPQRCEAFDDGPMRIVTFGDDPTYSWEEPRHLLEAREDASARILLCYEAYAPLELIHSAKVDMLFDGHSFEDHPDRDQFQPSTLHMRPPDQESIRWIPMGYDGLAPSVSTTKDVPSFQIPRRGQSPLRVEFSAENSGAANALTARITNETGIHFPNARVRFVLKAGEYAVSGAKILQAFRSDDGKISVVDVEIDVNPRSTVEATARRASG